VCVLRSNNPNKSTRDHLTIWTRLSYYKQRMAKHGNIACEYHNNAYNIEQLFETTAGVCNEQSLYRVRRWGQIEL